MIAKVNALFGAAAAVFVAQTAHAGPSDYVYTPVVVQGERELDFKMGRQRSPAVGAGSVGFGYGVMSRWFSELYVKFKHDSREPLHFDAVEWENKFQLTETGQYPVDPGFLLEIEKPADAAEGWEVRWGPLLQTQFNRVQLNFNGLLESRFGGDLPSETELMYQWQAKYLWRKMFDFGAQGFGEFGEWDHWAARSDQGHKAGPAMFGKWPLGGHQVLAYNAAWLWGVTHATPRFTFRMQVEYEF